jgi:molybdopterin converting factor small subunit
MAEVVCGRIGHNAAVRVILPRALVELFPGAAPELEVAAATVDDVTRALDALWPGMRDRIVDSSPAIRRHLNVFVDGARGRLETPLRPGATVHVLTSISGG